MEIRTLYITENDGKTTVSPIKPEGDYTTTYRVIAADGAEITNGTMTATVIDTDNPNEWSEVEQTDAEEIVNILTGGAS